MHNKKEGKGKGHGKGTQTRWHEGRESERARGTRHSTRHSSGRNYVKSAHPRDQCAGCAPWWPSAAAHCASSGRREKMHPGWRSSSGSDKKEAANGSCLRCHESTKQATESLRGLQWFGRQCCVEAGCSSASSPAVRVLRSERSASGRIRAQPPPRFAHHCIRARRTRRRTAEPRRRLPSSPCWGDCRE